MKVPKEATSAKETQTSSLEAHAPRPMTFAENAALTAKVLGGIGLLGAALWAINTWTAQ